MQVPLLVPLYENFLFYMRVSRHYENYSFYWFDRSREQTEKKFEYTGQQYVSDIALFPTLHDVTYRHSQTYGLKQML